MRGERARANRSRRGGVVLMVVGVMIGTLLITPVGAHITTGAGSLKHLWSAPNHIRDKADNRYVGRMYAEVSSAGDLVRGRRAVDENYRDSEGVYHVRFARDVTDCAVVATARDNIAHNVRATTILEDADQVVVGVARTDTQALADGAFYVVVVC